MKFKITIEDLPTKDGHEIRISTKGKANGHLDGEGESSAAGVFHILQCSLRVMGTELVTTHNNVVRSLDIALKTMAAQAAAEVPFGPIDPEELKEHF